MESSNQNQRMRIPFTKEEDEKLTQLINMYGENNWVIVSSLMQSGRTPRQCRDRWVNWVNVSFVKETWSPAEDNRLIQKVEEIGPHWKAMESFFPGRVSYTLRNRFAKLQKMKKNLKSIPQERDASALIMSPPIATSIKNNQIQNEGYDLTCKEKDNCSSCQNVYPTSCQNTCKKCIKCKHDYTSCHDTCKQRIKSKDNCTSCENKNIACENENNVCEKASNVCKERRNACIRKKISERKSGFFEYINDDEEQGFDWSENSWCRCTCASNIP